MHCGLLAAALSIIHSVLIVFKSGSTNSSLYCLFLCLFLLTACHADPVAPSVPPGDDDAADDDAADDDDKTDHDRITYNDDIQPLLNLYCGDCHAGTPADSCMGETCFANYYEATLYPAYSSDCSGMNKAECGLYRIELTLMSEDNGDPSGPRDGGATESGTSCSPSSCPNCEDGLDNDADGDIDCDDSDCNDFCNDAEDFSNKDLLFNTSGGLILLAEFEIEMIRQWIADGMPEE